jgi:exopolysaccharide biosynthesis polyprenyl glycosylphosphotransferase
VSLELWILAGAASVVLVAIVLSAVFSMAEASRPGERLLILGMTPLAEQLLREIEDRADGHCVVVGVVDDRPFPMFDGGAAPLLAPIGRLPEIVEEVSPDRVVVALTDRRGRRLFPVLLDSCLARGIAVEDAVEYYERITGKLAVESITPSSIVLSGKFRPSPVQQGFARALTLMVAVAGLVGAWPLMLLIVLAIKLDSPGPVFFVQERVGQRGRPFRLRKFRTMRVVAAPQSEWAGDNSDRVTRVGKWLRKLRLDELPQFVNMLRGEMNLVGPRPHPVSNLELFMLVSRNLNETSGTAVSYYDLRSLVRPGLTGWAQVRYGYANNLDEEIEKLRYDLYYVKNLSLFLDLRILFETGKLLFSGDISDGVRQTGSAGNGVEAGAARARQGALS